jgi:hypothetical protein
MSGAPMEVIEADVIIIGAGVVGGAGAPSARIRS